LEQRIEEQVIYPSMDGVNCGKYHFKTVGNGVIFSLYDLKFTDNKFKKFSVVNFRDIANCYYLAMQFDKDAEKSRKRKLYTFLNSMWQQDDLNVSLLMIKSVLYYYSIGYSEENIVGAIIDDVLPDAGYYRKSENGFYKWIFDDNKKFALSIGRAFILSYINNNFDKDITWKYVKKNCCLKNGVWHYKNRIAQERVKNLLNKCGMDGGIMSEQVDLNFETFVPLNIVQKDASGKDKFLLSKDTDDGKRFYVSGTASTTSIDWDEERVSENFIKSMKKQVINLPLRVNGHFSRALDDIVGVITNKGGSKEKLDIEGKLQKPENNVNVEKLVQKMDDGIIFGFSIYGKVIKTFVETDKKGKLTYVLDDGVLSHILITDQPANKDTFMEGILKSIKENKSKNTRERIVTDSDSTFKHNSNILKDEPKDLDIESSPDQAFPVNYSKGEIFKEYAHHYVKDNILYLHKNALFSSYQKAIKENASDFILKHLKTHLSVIGLLDKADDYIELASSVENLQFVEEKFDDEILPSLQKLKSSVNVIHKMNGTLDERKNMIKSLVSEIAQNITDSLNSLIEEV